MSELGGKMQPVFPIVRFYVFDLSFTDAVRIFLNGSLVEFHQKRLSHNLSVSNAIIYVGYIIYAASNK